MKLDLKTFFFTFLGAIFLLGFAFYNGYPIVYSDTSTYIASGFSLQPPIDRPITYGLFILVFSLNGLSLWTVAFMQSLIISFLILLIIKDFTQLNKPYKYFLFVIFFLSTLTVIPFVSGQIITDIFPSVGIICILHLALNEKLNRFNRTLLFSIFFISNAMHMSHLMINFLILVSIIPIKKLFFKNTLELNKKNIWITLVLTILGIFMMGSSSAKSKHVFFMGRMAENGILSQFLNENCHDNEYKLCDCIDSIPTNTTDFLWDEKSPIYTRYGKWSEAQEEFSNIIKLTFLSPKYLIRHIFGSIKNTLKQLLSFDAGDGNGPFIGESVLFARVEKYFKNESIEYSLSKQSQGLLERDKLESLNTRYRLTIIMCSLMLLLFYFNDKIMAKISANTKFIAILLLNGIFINAFVNASLVIVADRFGAKLIWFIPLILLLVVSEIDFNKTFGQDKLTKHDNA